MSVKNRPETIPKRGYALHPIRKLPTFETGCTAQEIPENDTEKLHFYRPIRLYQRKRQKGARNATHEQKAAVEWSFFLNHRNRITYNDLCRGCTHGCKQSFRAIIVLCPRYFSKRWKHREDTANGR